MAQANLMVPLLGVQPGPALRISTLSLVHVWGRRSPGSRSFRREVNEKA